MMVLGTGGREPESASSSSAGLRPELRPAVSGCYDRARERSRPFLPLGVRLSLSRTLTLQLISVLAMFILVRQIRGTL